MPLGNKLAAEFVGTFWLVFGGCGSAVLAAAFPEVGIGLLGVSLAFGLTVLTMSAPRRGRGRRFVSDRDRRGEALTQREATPRNGSSKEESRSGVVRKPAVRLAV